MSRDNEKPSKAVIIVLIVSLLIASGLMIYAVKLMNDKDNDAKTPVNTAQDSNVNGQNDPAATQGQADTKGGDAADNTDKTTKDNENGNGSENAGTEKGETAADNGAAGQNTDNPGPEDVSDNSGDASGQANTGDNAGETADTGNNEDQAGNTAGSDTKATDLIKANAKVSVGTLNVRADAGTGSARVKINDEAVELKRDDPLEILDVKEDWFHVYFVYQGVKGEGYTYGPYVTPNADSGFSKIVATNDPNNIKVDSVKY